MSLASYQTAPPRTEYVACAGDEVKVVSVLCHHSRVENSPTMKRENSGPLLTVDIIIEVDSLGLVLIERKNPPHGWALP